MTISLRPGAARRGIALWVGPLVLALAMLLPGLQLAGRLPHATGWRRFLDPTSLSVFCFAAFVAAWLLVVGVYHLILVPSHRDRQHLWRLWLPALYGSGGAAAAVLCTMVVAGLDQPQPLRLDDNALIGYPIYLAGLFLGTVVGQVLGRLAGDSDRVQGPRPDMRSVWITEVHPGPIWWALHAAAALTWSVAFFGPIAATGNRVAALAAGLSLATYQFVMTLISSRVTLILTADGIFVRRGYVGSRRTLLTMAGIESVEVAKAHLPRLLLSCLLPHRWGSEQGQLLLRNGPAVSVRTRWGERRWFTVPQASEMAGLLQAWRPQSPSRP
ncbi:MAG: hypothetical protein J2P45_28400 [Candidatus Dormibacteraeota bacterium]|nr:hypothetical protein [Candidatus Dormibacteraeota bacterium]